MASNIKDGTIKIGTWNTEWKSPKRNAGKIIKSKFVKDQCDILCVTEGFAGILPDGGHVIDAGPDWGCEIKKGRRKVLLWSKKPWTPHTHALGLEEFYKGRFVAGTTETDSGECLTVIGVCIPWSHSHVRFCKKNLVPWEDHKRWLEGFQKLRCLFPRSRTVVLGDFNQRIPRVGTFVPPIAHTALLQAFDRDGLQVATKGDLDGGLNAIDHIAHTSDLTLTEGGINVWPNCADPLKLADPLTNEQMAMMTKCADGAKLRLSDHFGVWGESRLAPFRGG